MFFLIMKYFILVHVEVFRDYSDYMYLFLQFMLYFLCLSSDE